jgi:hypothetical protein
MSYDFWSTNGPGVRFCNKAAGLATHSALGDHPRGQARFPTRAPLGGDETTPQRPLTHSGGRRFRVTTNGNGSLVAVFDDGSRRALAEVEIDQPFAGYR